MKFNAIATDYDDTIADHGILLDETKDALREVRRSNRRVILVTGRRSDDLRSVCSELDLFDLIVAENGALLLDPLTGQEKLIAQAAPAALVSCLREAEVPDLAVGRSIIATVRPHDKTVLAAIEHLGLDHQIVFNKGAVMVLPRGVNKATGLHTGLEILGLAPDNTVGIGDAENDHAFLRSCGFSVAVENALPALKAEADYVTSRPRGAGFIELARLLIANDLDGFARRSRV